jgi:hypothetical protein
VFGAALRISPVSLNSGPYEALKATDLAVVTDDALRAAIVDVYERGYPALARAEAFERDAVLEVFRPYYLREFADVQFGASATPRNYEAILNDGYFLNLLQYRLVVMRGNSIVASSAITAIQELVVRIDDYLLSQHGVVASQ